MSKKVSVIIPVYNVEKYLEQAMESVIRQNYDNYEVICIDDGSTDQSGKMLDSYSDQYDFIKVVHKTNTGYGHSMNTGLGLAQGDYISILEPDDYIAEDTLSSIMQIFDSYENLDFVKCDFAFVKGSEELQVVQAKIIKDESLYNRLLDKQDILKLYKGYIAHWTAVYSKAFLDKNQIRYHETPGASYQDVGFWFQSLMYAESAYLSDKSFYHYRVDNPGSSMNNPGKVYCTCEEYDYIAEIIEKYRNPEMIYPYYVKGRLISVKDTYRRIADEFRRDFLIRAEKDFRMIEKEGHLDLSQLSKEEGKVLKDIMNSAEELWKAKKQACNDFFEEIKKVEEFYIYGAGNLALFIYRLLDEEAKNKLRGFIVSRDTGDKELVGKPVWVFNEIREKIRYSKIVVGVSELYEEEIAQNLRNAGMDHYSVFRGGIV